MICFSAAARSFRRASPLTPTKLPGYALSGTKIQVVQGSGRPAEKSISWDVFSSRRWRFAQTSFWRMWVMTLREILDRKGRDVYATTPHAKLGEVVCRLVEKNCGSLVVRDEATQKMVGIITERDILRVCCAEGASYGEKVVDDVMTRKVVTGAPSESVGEVMSKMTRNRIRHLPVLEGGELVGMISIGDVVKAEADQVQLENHYLKSYIQS
ncbi:MAG: CBS domain-containing protein [Planctomycetota bacterium]|nr:MAG: CBS domain-containing protein [Planctomycetota bacterium]REJ89403.1 MAG: CBS domain-containing protein [Planctomycetota bacterium]REK26201.1 MAG: CBS domain-containing protein [Planctomycetota bacterium]